MHKEEGSIAVESGLLFMRVFECSPQTFRFSQLTNPNTWDTAIASQRNLISLEQTESEATNLTLDLLFA